MSRIKRLFAIIVAALAFAGGALFASSCAEDDTEKTYDVAIRVGCTDGKTYEFPVDTDELHVTIPYDGIERTFGIVSFNLPAHPEWGDIWLDPPGEGANVFSIKCLFTDEEGNQSHPDGVREKGSYIFTIIANSTSNLWNFRSCKLYITVE